MVMVQGKIHNTEPNLVNTDSNGHTHLNIQSPHRPLIPEVGSDVHLRIPKGILLDASQVKRQHVPA